jgi:tetratricopeptide (TPR) repeat protein
LDRARANLEKAVVLAREIGANELFARAVLGIAPSAIGVRYGKPDEVLIALGEEAMRRIPAEDGAIRARLLAHMSLAQYHAPKLRRLDLSQEAVEMARRVGDPSALLPALYSRWIALMGFDEARQRLEVSLELARAGEAAGSKEMALRGHFGCFRELMELGERPALDEALTQYERLAAELRQPGYSWLTPLGHSSVAMMEGRLDDCERLAMESIAIGKRAGDSNATLFFSVQIVTLRGLQGRSGEVIDRVRAFLAEHPFIPSWRATLAKLYLDMDRPEEARREMNTLSERDFQDHPRDGAFVVGMALLSQVSVWLGDTRVSRLLYDILLPFAARNIVIGSSGVFYGPVARHLGSLAAALGKWEEAENHFEAAFAMNTRIRSAPFLTLVQIEAAAALLKSGQKDKRGKALYLAGQGLKTAQRLGMQKAVSDAQALMARLSADHRAQ